MARRLPELSETHAAFARGELSYAKVHALTRVATAENEAELLELARFCTAAQLERTARAYRRVSVDDAREQLEDAYLSVHWNTEGSLELHGRIASEDGALLLRALDAQRDSRWRSRMASNAEALVAVAARSGAWSTRTTFATGHTAARRPSTTSSCSAAATIAPCTRAGSPSTSTTASSLRGVRRSRSRPAFQRCSRRPRRQQCPLRHRRRHLRHGDGRAARTRLRRRRAAGRLELTIAASTSTEASQRASNVPAQRS